MIHHRNLVAEAFEKAVESAQGRVGVLDVVGLFVSLYLLLCLAAS